MVPAGGATGEWDMQELSRIITSAGAVVASSGLIIYGMGVSYVDPGGIEVTGGLWMMILGALATVAGLVMYNRSWSEED
jgi:hypothetical protein